MNKKTSFRICKTDEWEDEIFFKADCACGSDDCNLSLHLEAEDYEEEDLINNTINLNLYTDLVYNSYYGIKENWFCNTLNKIKAVLRILFIGRIELNSSFMFRGEEQIRAFVNALEEGMERIKGTKS